MRQILILMLLGIGCNASNAQLISPIFGDSTHSILLPDVLLQSAKKSQTKKLFDFYQYNKHHTTEDILGNLPEINLIRRGSYGIEPVIRSYSSGQISILLDGMRIQGACTDKMDPSTIYADASQLSSVNVSTGGSAHINTSAPGGVIDLKLKGPVCHTEKPISIQVSSGFQSASKQWVQSASLNLTQNDWAIRLHGNYRTAQNYRAGGGTIIPNSNVKKGNIGLSVLNQLSEGKQIKTDIIADHAWFIGYPALAMDVGPADAFISAVTYTQEYAQKIWNKTIHKIYFNRIVHKMDDTHRKDVWMHMDMPGFSSTAGYYGEHEGKDFHNNKINFRYDASISKLDASMTMYEANASPMFMYTWPTNKEMQLGTGFSIEHPIDSNSFIKITSRMDFKKFLLTTAAKDQLSVLNEPLSPKIFLLKNIDFLFQRKRSNFMMWQAKLGYGERNANASELYGFYLYNKQDGYDYIGRTTLKPEIFLNADAAFIIENPIVKNSVRIYYASIQNYIMGEVNGGMSKMTPGAKGVKIYANIPFAQMAGVEWSSIFKPNAHHHLVATLKYNTGSHAIPMIAPLKMTLSYRRSWNDFFMEAQQIIALAQKQINENYGEIASAPYQLYHLKTGAQFEGNQSVYEIQAGIENIFDLRYREHTDWGGIPRNGRNFYLTLAVKL